MYEVVEVMGEQMPAEACCKDPMEGFGDEAEQERCCPEAEGEAVFIVVTAFLRETKEPSVGWCDWDHSEGFLEVLLSEE
jgi:hypothetical protein